MSVTIDHTRTRRFSTVKLRDGYDIAEVDRYVDGLERTVRDLDTQRSVLEEANLILRSELMAANERARRTPSENPASTASYAASRMLEKATREAERLVAEAREEAERLRAEAAVEVERRQCEVDRLAVFERAVRTQMADYFMGQLERLAEPTVAEALTTGDAPDLGDLGRSVG